MLLVDCLSEMLVGCSQSGMCWSRAVATGRSHGTAQGKGLGTMSFQWLYVVVFNHISFLKPS